MAMDEFIRITGAKEHNLKNINIDIPRNKLVVITGVSGSGKSSLAFDTIYAEGQRRYVESLSSYVRQILHMQNKPNVESITGLSPAIAIDQKTISKNPRSTVGTITEIYDYLRLLFARIGIPYSPATGLPIKSQTVSQMVDEIKTLPMGAKIYLYAPFARGQKGDFRKEFASFRHQGYQRVKIDNILYELDDLPKLDKNKKHDISIMVDRVVIEEELGNRLADSVETALKISNGILIVEIAEAEGRQEGEEIVFSERFSCPVSGFQIDEIEPRIFSFNSPYGACPVCDGIGKEKYFDDDLVVTNAHLSLEQGAIGPWKDISHRFVRETLNSLAQHYKIDLSTPFEALPEKVRHEILYGSEEEIEFNYSDGIRKNIIKQKFEGVITNLERRYSAARDVWDREEYHSYMNTRRCSSCDGYRLKQESLCIKIAGVHIGQVSELSILQVLDWCKNLPKYLNKTEQAIAERILEELGNRLSFLLNVGLDYLTLSRESATLSGGESQRIRLASQIGSGLMGVLYVLDEPSIGLHQADNMKLINTIKNLRDLGNSVIVVEHDEDTMRTADHLIDIGPGAGIYGGHIIAQGTPKEVEDDPNSITGLYLSGKRYIEVPKQRRSSEKYLSLRGAKTNNLKNIDIDIPLGSFVCVTGVSGGGKSSLIIHTLYKAALKLLENSKVTPGEYESIRGLEYIDKIIDIDQSPIGRTPRSNPATYTGAFSPIRDWYVSLPESKARGYKAGRFSFNVKGGRCEICQGDGMLKIEMHFLPDVYITCDACGGKRYNRETVEIKYKDKSIADILEMNVDQCLEFFSHVPLIRDKMLTLQEVGLGYISIGQSATTLSGGEAQRIKLAKELSKRSTGRTLYILDEPTTGLHMDDIKKLLVVLHKLVEKGNTVLVIEHNLDVIKTADYILDIGPGGGDKGGYLVAAGSPEELVRCPESITGKYLAPYLTKKQG